MNALMDFVAWAPTHALGQAIVGSIFLVGIGAFALLTWLNRNV